MLGVNFSVLITATREKLILDYDTNKLEIINFKSFNY